MSRATVSKANRLTIYLIKSACQRLEDVIESTGQLREVAGVGQFVFEASQPRPPAWITDFFGTTLGDDLGIVTSSAKAIFLVPMIDRGRTMNFVLSFGVGRHLLREGAVEERFGLKVVLNSLERESFRSIDKTTLGSVPKHSREQMGRDVAPADFGIDIEQDLVSSVTGKSNDARLGKVITGKDALHVSVPVDLGNLAEFLEHCLGRYRSQDYRQNFDWIDQIAEVRNGVIEDELNTRLVEQINQRRLNRVWMAVPELVDWAGLSGFRHVRAKRADLRCDVNIEEFLEEMPNGLITLDHLKNDHVFGISADSEDQLYRWTAFHCTYAEIDLGGNLYILSNGKWYEIARGFTAEVERDFAGIPEATVRLPNYTGGTELEYNTQAAQGLDAACCMDQQSIVHGGGHSRIEFCDIFTKTGKIIHVKKYGGSSVLSHLFSQGAVSGELFVSDGDFRAKLNRKLPRGYKLTNPRMTKPNASDYEIVYAIISRSENSLDIPFFSKVSLRNARRRLVGYGYSVTKKKVLQI